MSSSPVQQPIVLVHGIFGFQQLSFAGISVAEYFRGIPDALHQAGYSVPVPPALNPAGTIASRAEGLKTYLESAPEVVGKTVHLIAHSMGGLDSRYLISRLGMAERVATLTTIGTPHLGSPVADLVGAHEVVSIEPILAQAGIDLKGAADLTSKACERFDKEVPDSPKVRYFSIAGSFQPPRLIGQPIGLLGLLHDLVQHQQGDNDGVVAVRSADRAAIHDNWTSLGVWRGNHFRLINWGENILLTLSEQNDNSVVDQYKAVAARLTNLM